MEGPRSAEVQKDYEITEGLLAILEKTDSPNRDEQRQRAVLNNLPPNLITELKAHIHLQYTQREGYEKNYWGKELQELNKEERGEFERQILRGELFEMLTQNDDELIEKHSKTADELLILLQDPERYNMMEEIGKLRNPDLTYVDINDEGKIIIKGVGEAKLGKLNQRSLHQLETFEGSVEAVKRAVNNLKHSKKMRKYGFDGLANRKNQMEEAGEKGPFVEVADDFKRVLIVPSDRKTEGDGAFKNLFGKGSQNKSNRRRFKSLQSEIKIKKAAFSIREVVDLADYIYAQVE